MGNRLDLNSILIGSEGPKKLIAFYQRILGRPSWGEGVWAGWRVGSGFLVVGPHDQVRGKNKEPGRLLFNFETRDVQKEFRRIKDLGVRVVAEPYQPEQEEGMWIATFADPDGNYFQLMTPMS